MIGTEEWQKNLSEETVEELKEWLKLNKIDMTPAQWLSHCLKRLGLCEDKITKERFRRQVRRRKK